MLNSKDKKDRIISIIVKAVISIVSLLTGIAIS